MTKILIAEALDKDVLREVSATTKVEFVYKPDILAVDLEREIAEYDGLIVRPKTVSEKVINNGTKLKLVIRGGAGVNSIALDACKAKGIVVENTPGLNSDATAEYTMILMMKAVCRRMVFKSDSMIREGDTGSPEDFMGYELKGKKLGIIGLGNIGQRVAKIATAFGMEVFCYTRSQKDFPYKQTKNLKELLFSGSDIISIHIPLNKETNAIIGASELAQMKKGTIIINTARPQLIDAQALHDSANKGIISAFAIDGDYDLVKPFIHPKGIITHHIADMTHEAQANITRAALTQAIEFFEQGSEINRVA